MSWQDQGRQEHGWFGHGTAPRQPDEVNARDEVAGSLDQRLLALAHGAIGALPPALRRQAEAQYRGATLSRLTETMTAWVRGGRLDQASFADRFFGRAPSDPVVRDLRDAALGAASATSQAEMREATEKLADAIKATGLDQWPRFVADAQERAANVPPAGSVSSVPAGVVKAQWFAPLLTPKPPFFFADPPKGLIPRLMERIPRQSGKDAASDTPSWARGIPRRVGETPNDYAQRLMDDKYGPGKWSKNNPEFNKIKKFGQRGFRDPTSFTPGAEPGEPET